MKVVHANSFSQLLKLEKKTPLDSNIVMLGDDRWEDALKEFLACKLFAYDIETFGIEKWHPLWFRTGLIRLVQVGLPSGLVIVVDLGGWNDDRKAMRGLYNQFFEILGTKLADPEVLVLGTNLKFDGVFTLAHFGFKLRGARDIMLLSQILYGGVAVLPAGSGERQLFGHGLGKICEREGIEIDKQEQVSNWGWDLSNEQLNYAAFDTSVLFEVFKRIGKKIVEAGLQYSAESECAALSAFIDMEYYGFPVDLDLLNDYIKQHEDHLQVTIKPFIDSFPDINWNSGDQVLKVLQEKYPDLDISSTSADTLAPLDIPECNALLKSRTIQTTTKYLINLREVAFKYKDDELMAVRGFYQQIAPEATGRSSCKASLGLGSGNIGAQLQNPKSSSADEGILPHPRDIFRVPDTHSLIVLDAAAAHARIATAMAKPKVLIKAYNEGFDNHSLLAVEVAKIARDFYLSLVKDKKKILPALQEIFDLMPEGRSWTFGEFLKLKKQHRVLANLRDISKVILYGCVPLDTQCLTKTGWRNYYEVKVGEEILAYDADTKTNKWTPILEKFFYKDRSLEEWRVGKYKRFVSTPEHRWYGRKRKQIGSKHSKTSFRYYDDVVFTTEDANTECIIQNTVQAESGTGTKLDFVVDKKEQDSFWFELVISMTNEERYQFLSNAIATDGSKVAKNSYTFVQDTIRQPGLYYAVQLCGYLLGFNVVDRPRENGSTCRVLSICSKQTTGLQHAKKKTLPNQDVWCVKTEYDSWVVKDSETGFITITGNSLNGAGVGRLTNEMHGKGFEWVIPEVVSPMRDQFYNLYPEIPLFIKNNYKSANLKNVNFNCFKDRNGKPITDTYGYYGYVTSMTGRRKYLAKEKRDAWGKTVYQVDYGKATAALWLMAEGDMMKSWMGGLILQFDKNNFWGAYIANVSHDEVNVVSKTEYALDVAKYMYNSMKEIFESWLEVIPFDENLDEPDYNQFIGNSWSELH